jgi:cell division protein FtsB
MAGRQRTRIGQRKLVLAVLMLIALSFGYSIALGPHGFRRYVGLRTRLVERSRDAYARIVRNREMSEEIARLRSDDRALEAMARTRLGVAHPDEVVLVFGDEAASLRDP